MKTVKIAVLSLVMLSGYNFAESTSLSTVKNIWRRGMRMMLHKPLNILRRTQSIMMPPRANR